MYKFHFEYLRNAMNHISGAVTTFCKQYSYNKGTVSKWLNGDSSMTVMQYAEFLNRFRISPALCIRPFDSKYEEYYDEIIQPAENWTPVYFDAEKLKTMFICEQSGVNQAGLAAMLNTTTQNLSNWFGSKERGVNPNMNTNIFINICNTFHLNPSEFLVCSSHPIPCQFMAPTYNELVKNWIIKHDKVLIAELQATIYKLRMELTIRQDKLDKMKELVREANDNVGPNTMKYMIAINNDILSEQAEGLKRSSDLLLDDKPKHVNKRGRQPKKYK